MELDLSEIEIESIHREGRGARNRERFQSCYKLIIPSGKNIIMSRKNELSTSLSMQHCITFC